jgi:hypothetical protein
MRMVSRSLYDVVSSHIIRAIRVIRGCSFNQCIYSTTDDTNSTNEEPKTTENRSSLSFFGRDQLTISGDTFV